jgi:hypothetical protein
LGLPGWEQGCTALDHPPPKVTEQSVKQALHAMLQLLEVVFQRIYNKKYRPGSLAWIRIWNRDDRRDFGF